MKKSGSPQNSSGEKKLGQAKLINRFPFQGFQNSMLAGGHFFIIHYDYNLENIVQKPH